MQARNRRLYFLPEPSGPFLVAQEQAVSAFAEQIKVEENLAKTIPELFWFPPASIFNVEAPSHLPDLIGNAATLLPLFVERLRLSHDDPSIRPLKRTVWKSVLRFDHFEARKVGLANWWKAGDKAFFGEKWGAELVATQVQPNTGKMGCGCPITKKDYNSTVFINVIAYTLNRLNLLYQVAKICRPQIAKETNMAEELVPVPNFFDLESYKHISAYRLIVWTVMGRDVPEPSGLVGPLTGLPRSRYDKVSAWLSLAKDVLPSPSILPTSHPVHPACLEATTNKFDTVNDMSIVDWVEKALIERLFTHCFEVGDWLPELSARRPPAWATFCQACQNRAKQLQDCLDETEAKDSDDDDDTSEAGGRSPFGTKRKASGVDFDSCNVSEQASGMKRARSTPD
jgi:hypothetical protein